MKFCSYCGAMLNDQDAVCSNCGKSVMPVQPDPFADIFVQSQEQPSQNDQHPANTEPQPYYGEAPVNPDPFAGEAPVSSDPYYYNMPMNSEPPAPKKKVKWWMIAVPVVLVIAVAVVLLWNPLMLRFAPETVLANALADVSGELAERNVGSPLEAIANAVDENGGYTMGFDMYVSLGDSSEAVEFDMELLWEGTTLERQLNFYLTQGGEYLDASLYVDTERLALSSERLLKDEAFGITYATFSEDMRGNELFADMDEETLSILEEYVDMLQKANAGMGEQTPFADEYAAVVTEFVDALEPVVASGERAVLGTERKMDTISYTVTYQELAQVMEDLLEIMEMDETIQNQFIYSTAPIEGDESLWDEFVAEYEYMIDALADTDGAVVVSFWLYKYDLVCLSMDMTGEYEGESFGCRLDIELGEDPAVNDIIYRFTVTDSDGEEGEIEVVHSTVKSGSAYAETLEISVTDPYESTGAEISYEWDKDSEKLSVAVEADGAEIQFELGLAAEEDGFTLYVDDLYEMLADAGMDDAAYYSDIQFRMELNMKQGADVTIPEFKNIDQWTQKDILNLAMEFQNLGT